MDEDAELRNPFPSPPSHYKTYTNHNLNLLRLLQERTRGLPPSQIHQREILTDQQNVPEWPLTQLEKPRADWILEDTAGYYDVFGDRWFVRSISYSIKPENRLWICIDQRTNPLVSGIRGTSALSG
jgi:mediator of RNA polymerase II transcription subunit 7